MHLLVSSDFELLDTDGGIGNVVTAKRATLFIGYTPMPTEEGELQTLVFDTCIDTNGLPKLGLYQVWMEYKCPSQANPGVCRGLYCFSDVSFRRERTDCPQQWS